MIFDDLKTYINEKISNESGITESVTITKTYPYGKTIITPQIMLQIADNTENVIATTFEGEQVSTVLLQVIVLASAMSINSKKYNAQNSCDILCEKLVNWFDKAEIVKSINSIKNCRRVQWLPSTPYETGTTTYAGLVRFELAVIKQ